MFQRSGGLVPGKELRALELGRAGKSKLTMGVFNCYEDTLPGLGRRIAGELGPNLLVNVTNDAWFVGTQEPELHLRLSVLRSIELRRALVRAVNLGVPAWIDAAGRVISRNDDPGPGFLLVEPQLYQGSPTVYARFGDWPTALALALAAALAAWRERRRDA
jgi:apolipoprotein N-acyltransferase